MSLDAPHPRPQRIAVIGGGISGLAAAWLLAPQHAVTLFEAAPRLGGHARTVMAGLRGDQPVDTGFIVFNYANYPHLTALFRDLDVPVARSDMSFGASIDGGRIEYALRDLRGLAAQPGNLLRPGYLRMLRDILAFNAKAEAALGEDATATIGDLIYRMGLGDWFRRFYLTPLCGAIWSTSVEEVLDFPARAILRFFRNHALLSASGQHQWWTVQGGSRQYVTRLERHLRARGVAIRTGCPVARVQRVGGAVALQAGGEVLGFDQVVFACHADQALRLLADPSRDERAVLGAIRFQDNRMVLHRDSAQMPRRRAAWSSWVYLAETRRPQPAIGVTYWMNRLQNIPEADPLFVSLNPAREVPDRLVYDQTTFRHPVFNAAALRAQAALADVQGQRGTWFAGAWTRNGFHEDGFASAVRIARQIERQVA